MSKFFYSPSVGIDVSADFSMVSILSPSGEKFRKPFKISHNSEGFTYLSEEIKKVEDTYSMKTPIFMESTGVYHLTLFYFLKNHGFNVFVINPLITNSNKNKEIRKAKNDKLDSLSIAKIGKFEDIKMSDSFDVSMFSLKNLCREYYNLTDTHSQYKKKLTADLYVMFPGYCDVFDEITGKASISILKKYQSPNAILDAPKEELMKIIAQGRQTLKWRENVYNNLIKAAGNAISIGIPAVIFSTKLNMYFSILETLELQIKSIVTNIKALIESDGIPDSFRNNLLLIEAIPGMGFITSITLLAEMGDFNRFAKPKQLVAFFGIDPSVNESGKFKSNDNKISKRGTSFGRRALYTLALHSIRRSNNGQPVNAVLHQYYKSKVCIKKKKTAIMAVMHKLLNYIFAALRDQKKFEVRDPEIHKQLYLYNVTG